MAPDAYLLNLDNVSQFRLSTWGGRAPSSIERPDAPHNSKLAQLLPAAQVESAGEYCRDRPGAGTCIDSRNRGTIRLPARQRGRWD